MALFEAKNDRERAAAAKLKTAERAAAAARQAKADFAASPPGKAAEAFARGNGFFQVEIPHSVITGVANMAAPMSRTQGKIRRSRTPTDVLGQIEMTGWRLEHADWVYVQTGQNSRDKLMASGQQVVVTGEVLGIYLFRRDETRFRADAGTRSQTADVKPPAPAQSRAATRGTAANVGSDPTTTSESEYDAGSPETVSCSRCQLVQSVPANILSFTCEGCGLQLNRRTWKTAT